MTMRSFGSDNHSGVHPAIMEALVSANRDHCPSYGNDHWTRQAESDIRAAFSPRAEVAFVFNGTGANCVALQAITRPHHAILVAETGHIWADECGAPGRLTGCQVIPIATPQGKLTPGLLAPYLTGFGDEHRAQPHVVSLSQCTELGTVYTRPELLALSALVHSHGMLLHMDGARLSNACASLDCSLSSVTAEAGVDIVSFGGTKNGLMFGETVIALTPEAQGALAYVRKQTTQLASKMRFLSAQFSAYLRDSLWLANAQTANAMAQQLSKALRELPHVQLVYPTEANEVFVSLPHPAIRQLQEEFYFYVWEEAAGVCRFVTSWNTVSSDVEDLVKRIKHLISS